MRQNIVKVSGIKIGKGQSLVIIAGPCVIENEKSALYHAERLVGIAARLRMPFIYKSSYDKANRTSASSFRGPGLKKGLAILKKVKKEFNVPVVSDVHCKAELEPAKAVLDIIQIPAFLCRQTDLLIAAAKSKKPVNVKKGQFLAPWDVKNIIDKIVKAGNNNVIITERGTSFGYNNLVSDMRSIPIMKKYGCPVIYDATHSVQLPGGLGTSSGGQREFTGVLARAAVVSGADGIFVEVHVNPGKALSDGPNMISLKECQRFFEQLKELSEAAAEYV